MNWSDVLADPNLHDLPYKIELNGYGQIVMTPASNRHGRLQAEIAALISGLRKSGVIITECSVETSQGTKVPDVAWVSDAFYATHGESTPSHQHPSCVSK